LYPNVQSLGIHLAFKAAQTAYLTGRWTVSPTMTV
jgi:hypothetical protein